MKFKPRLRTLLINTAATVTVSQPLFASPSNPASTIALPTLEEISTTGE